MRWGPCFRISRSNKIEGTWMPVTVEQPMSPEPSTTRFLLESEISFILFKLLLFLSLCFWFCEDGGCCFYSESNVSLTEKASTLLVSLKTPFNGHFSQEAFLISRQNTPFPDLTILILFLTRLILILIPLNYTLPI